MKRRHFCLAVFVAIAIAACSSRPSTSKFVGTWQVDGSSVSTEYTDKGVLMIHGKKGVLQESTWEFKDDKHLLLGGKDMVAFRFQGDNILIFGEEPREIKCVKIK